MVADQLHTLDDLEMRIRACGYNQFTGRLDLEIQNSGLQWSFFFYQGGLIWGTTKVHPVRRWWRQIAQYCPQLAIDSGQIGQQRSPNRQQSTQRNSQRNSQHNHQYYAQYIDHSAFVRLAQQGKVSPEQMTAVITGKLQEILFDLIQFGKQHGDRFKTQLVYGQLPKTIAASSSTLIPVEHLWQQALQAWSRWQQAGLENWSPNWAPVIWDKETLRQHTSLLVYHNLTTWVNGDRTLRDLAVKLKQPLVALTQSLIPYLRKGIMGLIEVRDWQYNTTSKLGFVVDQVTPLSQVRSSSPLVAYIEDSRFDCIVMSQILARAGCRFINIQDPVQAIPALMEQKPDAIFLDLLMPITNGYEVCAQIRRISALHHTPVIIVTSSDGIVDRVRAKLVGSSGFVSKPIEPDKIISVLSNHLPSSALSSFGKKSDISYGSS